MLSKGNKIMSEKKRAISFKKSIFFFIISFFSTLNSFAQCAMCRASLESEGNVIKNEALNNGIVYLMAIPYLLVGVVGIVTYRMYKKRNSR